MARARKILRHMHAIKNIRAVTKAMYMVSTARFKKTHDKLVATRPYLTSMFRLVAYVVAARPGGETPALMRSNESGKSTVLLVLASHRGLCSSYNNSVARLGAERRGHLLQAGYEVKARCSGKRGRTVLESMGVRLDREYTQFDYLPNAQLVGQLADELMAEFLSGAVSGLEVAYTQFISSGQQKPVVARVLPLTELQAPQAGVPAAPQGRGHVLYELIPAGPEILDHLLPTAVRMKLYQCFIDAAVSEQVARMTSMQSATKNAEDLIHDLNIRYNRARQAQITTELAEIMGGQEGVSGA